MTINKQLLIVNWSTVLELGKERLSVGYLNYYLDIDGDWANLLIYILKIKLNVFLLFNKEVPFP